MRTAEQQVEDARGRIERVRSSLHPSVASEKDAVEMQVPPRARVQAHRDRVQDWERRNREVAQELAKVEQEIERLRRDFNQVVSRERAITVEELERAREYRDGLWRLVKKKYIENVPLSGDDVSGLADVPEDLAAAFEPATRSADELADRRFDNAEAAGRLAELSRTVAEREFDVAQLHARRKGLAREGEGLDADWEALWGETPLEALPPDAMLEWLDTRDELLEAVERRAEAAGALEMQGKVARDANESVAAELSVLGIDRAAMAHDALPVILERADSVRREHEQKAEAKVRLDESLREAVTLVERRRHELDRAEQARLRWQEAWSAALTTLGFAAESEPEAVSARIDVIDQMREKAGRISDLRHQRIGKINRDIADFEAVVANMVGEVAGDLAGAASDEALLEIEKRLEAAERTRDLRERKVKETGNVENEVRVLVEERKRARESIGHLRNAAGVESDEELRRAIGRSDSLRSLRGELDATLHGLRLEGDGRTPIALERECEGIEVDGLAAREESTAAELTSLRDRLAAAAEARAQAREEFQAAGGDDAAARAEARRQEALAEIRDVSARYVRVRGSALLMQWAIDRYRREKQAPLLRRAGRLFATITRASFDSLRVDYDEKDQPYLTGLRPSGEVVRVSGMSSGTVDQLYLALRIAAVEDYLDHGQAMPFVADDLFINFDDDRAGAGFRVLGELSRKTQVLFFTHHSHLLDIARGELRDSMSQVSLSG